MAKSSQDHSRFFYNSQVLCNSSRFIIVNYFTLKNIFARYFLQWSEEDVQKSVTAVKRKTLVYFQNSKLKKKTISSETL